MINNLHGHNSFARRTWKKANTRDSQLLANN